MCVILAVNRGFASNSCACVRNRQRADLFRSSTGMPCGVER
jgi:hypothetical protein